MVDGRVWLAWSDGATWRHHVMPADESHDDLPGYIAVAGDHVASVSGYDGATVLPVADLAITTDGGATWRDLHQPDLPFRHVDAMAATAGGTLFVATPPDKHHAERLYRSADATWTRFVEVANPQRVDSLVPAGDHVLGRGGTFEVPAFVAFDDAGRATPGPPVR